jgi:hypothetical protein
VGQKLASFERIASRALAFEVRIIGDLTPRLLEWVNLRSRGMSAR